MACYMGLVSFFASRHEVLKVTGWNRKVRERKTRRERQDALFVST